MSKTGEELPDFASRQVSDMIDQRCLAKRTVTAAAAAAAVFVAGVGGATGQSQSDNHSVVRRLEASEVKTRSEHGGTFRTADLFGESDEEKAARLQKEQAQDAAIVALQQRVDDLENSLRRVTGQLEQLDHKNAELNNRIERMQKDFDYKLCAVVAQQMGASTEQGDTTALPCAQTTQTSISSSPSGMEPAPAQGPIHLAPPPGVLGTLPAGSVPQGPPPAQPQRSASLSINRAKFDSAMTLLARAQYDEARSAFRAFADTYPDDELTPQAIYWIADIAYVQKDYANAAHAFAEEIKKYPASPRAPESMLKLGQSLIAMGQKKEGCTALAALSSKYPDASKTVAARASEQRKATGCR